MYKKIITGFTLIEVMIVVVILAILTMLAVPSYQEYMARSKRADVQGALYGLASAMTRFYTENNTYCGSDDGGTIGTCVSPDSPGIFSSQVPISGGTAYYNLTISAVAANSYTLTATRTGTMNADKCGDFTLQHTNVRGLNNESAGINVNDCWR